MPDPLNAILGFAWDKIKQGVWAAWLRFLFEMWFSATVSFLFTCGTVLMATHSETGAIGSGMVMAAICMTVLFRREKSKLTKDMLVVLPSAEAAQEIATDLQEIQKPEK